MRTHSPLALAALVASTLYAPLATAAPPGILNHQGRLAANGQNFGSPTPATGHFKFALVNGDGTESFWTNDNTNTGSPGGEPSAAVPVTVTNGFYSVGLGDTTLSNMTTAIPVDVLAAQDDVRLRIWFSADNVTFEQLSPDHRLLSAPYALNAKSLSLAVGATAGHVLTSDAIGNGSWASPVPGPQGPPGTNGADGALAGLACGVGQVAVFNGAEWVCQDFPGFEWTPEPQTANPFRVEINPGPPAMPGSEWTKVLEGGLLLDIGPPPGRACWEDLTLAGPVQVPDPARPRPDPLTTRDFAVQELYGPDTVRVQGISVHFPKIPSGGAPNPVYKEFRPGQPVFGNVTIIGRTGGNSINVKRWVKDVYEGRGIRKEITITLRSIRDGAEQLEIRLFDCTPVSYRPLHRNESVDPRNPSFGLEAIELKVGRMEIFQHASKPSLVQWYGELLNQGEGAALRDINIVTLNPDGSDGNSINYLDCFLTSYSLAPLNAEESGVEVEETIEIAVGYSDNFLN